MNNSHSMIFEIVILVAVLILVPLFVMLEMSVAVLILIILAICAPIIRLIANGAPPYIPTSFPNVKKMVELAEIKPGEHIYVIGYEDGRLSAEAAKKNAIVVGYQLAMRRFLLVRLFTRGYPNATVKYANFWKQNYADADVIFCYFLPEKMRFFEKHVWPTLKPGCRVVSHGFSLPNVSPERKAGGAYVHKKTSKN